ncbi:MAG: hypothetical protein E5V57_20995 [Mesorhizobium sp.]|nr:MAG: hypothetical protein E5V57_20995 [Mesorhizobium sp.]
MLGQVKLPAACSGNALGFFEIYLGEKIGCGDSGRRRAGVEVKFSGNVRDNLRRLDVVRLYPDIADHTLESRTLPLAKGWPDIQLRPS